MGLNFTTIDFETANETRASACAVGLTTVRHGRVIETRSWYIQPPGGTRFTNTHIHGIQESHLRDAPTWSETVAIIDEISDGTTLVAYNSPFDKGVHKAACTVSGVDHPGHVWRDARVLAKTHLSLENYRLPHVSRHLGLPAFDHHDPGEDAEACAQVTLRIASMAVIDDIGLLWPVTAVPTGTGYRRYTPPPPASVTADPRHPLYGVSVTFTGELVTLSRPEAQAAVAALGATVTAGPTRKTDVVVVGGFDPSTLRAGSTVSSKLRRAVELKEAGRRIELISEADLIALIAYEPDR